MANCPACGRDNPEGFQFCGFCSSPLVPSEGREVRKTVTVLFSDLADSTSLGQRLDPESLRHLMSRYFDEMQTVLVRHGGTVEKFIGDAVMAVFGIPRLHEDDALRAVRAAIEMREASPPSTTSSSAVAAYGSRHAPASTPARSWPAIRASASRSSSGTRSTWRPASSRRPQPGEILIGDVHATARPRRGRRGGDRAAHLKGRPAVAASPPGGCWRASPRAGRRLDSP